MAAARIAATILAVATAMAGAQQTPQNDLLLTATDQTGAPVAGARVELDSAENPSWAAAHAITDGQGKVKLNLPTGSYILIVNACGSSPWIRKIILKEGTAQSIAAEVKFPMVTESVCVDQSDPQFFGIQAEPPLLLPLESLGALPLRPMPVKGSHR
jgi:hypothetical protein